ncbi:MAG: hypothetical protein WAN30_06020 [Acidimicrobiales bacterium]
MKSRLPHHYLLRSITASALGVFLCVGSVASASATTASIPVGKIVANGYANVDTIRSFFFCETSACKKDKSATASSAAMAMSHLESEASSLSKATVPKHERPIVTKFIDDVRALNKVFSVYAQQTTANEVTRNTGVVYYESANVGSDIYLLTSAVHGARVLFADWGVGAVAVLYTMQIETELVSAKSSSAATDVAANVDLEQDAAALIKDANGPDASFNQLLVKFADAQETVSKAENDVLERKKLPLSNAKLKSDISSLGAQFTKIVDLQRTLAK